MSGWYALVLIALLALFGWIEWLDYKERKAHRERIDKVLDESRRLTEERLKRSRENG